MTNKYFNNDGTFNALAVSTALWNRLGQAYSGMEFPVPENTAGIANLTCDRALFLLTQLIADHATYLLNDSHIERVNATDFFKTVSGMMYDIAEESLYERS